MTNKNNRQTSQRQAIIGLVLILLILVGDIITGAVSSVSIPPTQTGTGTTMINGNNFQNTTSITFSKPLPKIPGWIGFTLTAIPAAFTQHVFWTTALVDAPLTLNTPFLDVFSQHDKNYAACPCTDTVTVTPTNKDEIIVVNTNAVDGVNVVSVTSVTSSPSITFTKRTFTVGGANLDFEQWTATSFVTSPITITVTFNDPSTTGLTTGIVAGVFGNVVGIGASVPCNSGVCSIVSPVTVANLTMFRQSSLIVGGLDLSNLNTSCNDPTPAGNPLQTQVTNDNTFCHTNVAGSGTFPQNYDMEYVNLLDQPFYLYNTGFNGTTIVTNGGVIELYSGYNQNPSWTVTPAGTELLNTREYERSIAPPFQGQPVLNGAHGKFSFTCSFASTNATVTVNMDILNFPLNDPVGVVLKNQLNMTLPAASLCDGQLHSLSIISSFGLNGNYVARVKASCTSCGSSMTLGVRDVTIDWDQVIQNIPHPILTASSATGFTVTWRTFYPAAINSIFTWEYRAET